MLSIQQLPNVFAVMDPSPSLPSRYYVFITYQSNSSSIQVIHNLKFHRPFTVNIDYTEEPANKTNVYYSFTESEITYWKVGINIVSDENEVIPVLDFNTPIFLPSESWRISPVYVTPDSTMSKCDHQMILRSRRNHIRYQYIELIFNTVNNMPPLPPSIQRVIPVVEDKKSSSFTLPSHAAAAFVRALIQEKKTCSITTNSFDEINIIGFTPCFHCFDCEALEAWLFNHNTCPECRSEVHSIVKYKR